MLADKLQSFISRYQEIDTLLTSNETLQDIAKVTTLAKERSSIEPIVLKAKKYISTIQEIQENKELLEDPEFNSMAKEELKILEPSLITLEEDIHILLLPKDPFDDKNIILEMRAGAGGDEASIFVGDMLKMYIRFAELNKWKIEMMSSSEGTNGGYKEVVMSIEGTEVYSKLKYEGGTHRVQRVPKTESQGRVHTSAITVAVIPDADDIEIDIQQSDLKIDVMRSSGNGGQSVNTTDSAVRITHIPSGLVVTNQDGKSQHKNKDKAMKVLKARLYDMELQKKNAQEKETRSDQVGSGDRSEKIRTYNYPQNRLTDHRINLTLYKLDYVMESGDISEVIENLISHEQSKRLENIAK
jgi:peptide chain release factor 1